MLKNILIKTTCNSCCQTLDTRYRLIKFIPGTITPEDKNAIAENIPLITDCTQCGSKAIVHTYATTSTVTIKPT